MRSGDVCMCVLLARLDLWDLTPPGGAALRHVIRCVEDGTVCGGRYPRQVGEASTAVGQPGALLSQGALGAGCPRLVVDFLLRFKFVENDHCPQNWVRRTAWLAGSHFLRRSLK